MDTQSITRNAPDFVQVYMSLIDRGPEGFELGFSVLTGNKVLCGDRLIQLFELLLL